MSGGDNKRKLTELLKAGGYDDDATAPYSPAVAEASKEVQRRICALKKYQLESIALESEFYKRVHKLEEEFQAEFDRINDKRKAVVTGAHEPTDEESDLPLIHGLPDDELQKLRDDAPVEGTPSKGIPDFWLHVLNNTAQVGDMIHEYDEPILKYLTDVTTEVHSNPTGFTLLFHFAENPYFTNTVLKKYYELNVAPDPEEPFDYDGPTITKCTGTEIQWKEGKNVTQKVSNESFFNFFEASTKELTEELDADAQDNLRNDFEVGQVIRDQIIPRAVLFYTGEGIDEDEFDDFEDEEDDELGEDSEMDDE